VEVAIRNRSRKEAIVAWHDAFRRAGKNLTATFVVTTPGVAAFEARHAGGTIDHAWLADAELVMVSLEPLGRFERTIKIENFALPTAQNPTTTTGRN
jgi:hypothetical protein